MPTPKIRDFETGLYRFLEQSHPKLLPTIAKEKALSDETQAGLREAVIAYRREGGYESAAEEAARVESKSAEDPGDQPKADEAKGDEAKAVSTDQDAAEEPTA